ncbi:universal stress protein [Haloferax mediterranei ATCC 33500]|uniref:Universal stress protein n=1 Tax=Haloferax mediterranei (strain ATCC 33500 / DSM 1411 / JCM 8866 / NBRC 14739 / NCIMB 2177 / R-4) TaxID=523841 RepID=I3R4U2_HALMT|nr:universal stress protein [Haloferax mediterranei]AFK19252.1 UspA domain protein [Haloferax mediterranei ATCC 33500]AHZ21389.1 universal stress protein UspA [Haloferax mediterranei ATCC 33500]EMA04560.1 UspA domain-containing protein [Haloferax mediterranei ATCC 33500]MDX5989354.1 universal stress protein [Haloferax mediterranei ATCC 33500]QCQ75719.1 universal stress protein [Haloferax mediterranei ATCC 33500]
MYSEILVPTDGSRAAERAIDHALNLAETYDARIHALYVVDTSIYTSLDAGADVVIDALEREGEAATRHVREAAEKADVEFESEVMTGTAYRSIRKYTEDHDIDLVVMGTHGRTGLSHYLLGSVTERVVRTSPVPVLTTRMQDEEETEESADATGETNTEPAE